MSRRNWTKQDEDKLLELEQQGRSYEEIALYFDRTSNSIESKLNKLHIKLGDKVPRTGVKWTPEQLQELSELVDSGKSLEELAEHFNRTTNAIEVKVNRIGKQLIRPNRYWKDTEETSFAEDWEDGTLSVKQLIKKYNRPWFSLRKRAQLLKLGPRPYNDEYVSVTDICREMQVSNDRVYNWFKLGLKKKKNRSGKVKYVVDTHELLKFLEQHQDHFEADKVSEYLFWDEPEWFKAKRKRDIQINMEKRRVPWTNEEDKRLEMLFCRGKSDEEIAKALKRTPSGVMCRRLKLGLVKNRYMNYEIEILMNNSRYKTVAELNKMLPLRSYKGIISKCEQLNIPYHVSKERCEIESND